MRYLVGVLSLILGLAFSNAVYAVNTKTEQRDYWRVKSTMSFDTTGRQCTETLGKVHLLAMVKYVSGTGSIDLEVATSSTPAAGDVVTMATFTATDAYKITMNAPFICANVTACTACQIVVTLYAQ